MRPPTWLTLSDIPSRRTVPSPGNALLAVAAGVAAASLAAAWLAFPIRVTSNSMAPYVRAGDYGVAVYTDHKARGDVIAFHFPFGAPTLAIKRAVILPGECMPPQGSGVGARLEAPAVAPGTDCPVVPAGAVYVVGDNIAGSLDSRHFGAVPGDQIVGKLVPVSRWLARWHEMIGAG